MIGHDSVIGDCVGISANVTVGSRVTVGACVFLCLSATVGTRVKVGAGAIVGAGSVVLNDVPDAVLAMGNPARPVWRVDEKFDWKKIL